MMIRFKDISIPKPCSVDYDSLSGNEIKRFCGSCEKQVYDFRGKDEIYFNSIIQTHGKVCGVFYEDEIKKTPVPSRRSFYHSLTAKLIGMLLFFKTLFSSEYAEASEIKTNKKEQQSVDSSRIKIEYKNKHNYYATYSIDIFINNTLYKSGYNPDKDSNYLWLPDSLKENDNIKVVIRGSKRKLGKYSYKTKNREYNFTYSESNNIVIKITSTRNVILIRKKRRAYGGYFDY